jgi:DGQHR domain-containing protein
MPDYTIEGTYVKQGGLRIFYSTAPALMLCDEAHVITDYNSPSNREGYQRPPNERRMGQICDHLLGESDLSSAVSLARGSVSGQSIMLNSRAGLKPKVLDELPGGAKRVEVRLTGDWELYCIDGQHRKGGIQKAVNDEGQGSDDDSNTQDGDRPVRDWLLPVAIFDGLSRREESVLFYIINTTQKGVSADVCDRILRGWDQWEQLHELIMGRDQEYIAKAIDIIDALNKEPNQPWYKKIKTPGDPVKRGTLTSQTAFTKSLKPLLKHETYKDTDVADLTKLIVNYWKALEAVAPECFENPREYMVQKTLGVHVLNGLIPAVLSRLTGDGRATAKNLQQIVRSFFDFHSEGTKWWSRHSEAGKYGTNNKSFTLVSRTLEQTLPAMSAPAIRF